MLYHVGVVACGGIDRESLVDSVVIIERIITLDASLMSVWNRSSSTWFLGFLSGVLVAGCVWPVVLQLEWSKASAQDKQPKVEAVQPAIAKEDPPYRGLDANLYMQTSAEYRASCLQTHHWADRLVAERLASRSATEKPVAVVFDLDEGVQDGGVWSVGGISCCLLCYV